MTLVGASTLAILSGAGQLVSVSFSNLLPIKTHAYFLRSFVAVEGPANVEPAYVMLLCLTGDLSVMNVL